MHTPVYGPVSTAEEAEVEESTRNGQGATHHDANSDAGFRPRAEAGRCSWVDVDVSGRLADAVAAGVVVVVVAAGIVDVPMREFVKLMATNLTFGSAT